MHLDPKLARAYIARGNALRLKALLNPALDDLNTALALSPDNADALAIRAIIWLSKGAPDRSIQDCNQSIKIDSRSPGTFETRGACFAAKGNQARAKADRDEADRLRRELAP